MATITTLNANDSGSTSRTVINDNFSSLNSDVSNLPATQGGTGITSYTTGDIFYASSSTVLSKLPIGTSGQTLRVSAGLPAWSSLPGTGTVTSVSVVTANGVSGSVATDTTTPAITLSLGSITPSAVQVSGLTASEIVITDASKNLVSAAVATYPSLTELAYVKGVTSAIQTQLNAKASIAGTEDITGTKTFSASTVLIGGGASATELRFLEPSGSGTNYSAIKAQAQSANITYTLPATVASAGQVLTDAAGNGTLSWATPSAGSTTKMHISSIFETSARFAITNTNAGMTAFGSSAGADVNATSTASSASKLALLMSDDAIKLFAGSPTFSVNVRADQLNATGGTMFFGIGNVAVDGTSHTFTNNHIGFKIVESGGTKSLYATQADGTTENASSALTTVAVTDYLTLILKVNSTTSVDYYWQKSGGALSSATNLTSNLPTAATQYFTFSTTNAGSANTFDFIIDSMSYER